jgi:hypothetical protein
MCLVIFLLAREKPTATVVPSQELLSSSPVAQPLGSRARQSAGAHNHPIHNGDNGPRSGERGYDSDPAVRIAKWYDDHAAAISLTYDGFVDTKESLRVQRIVLERGTQLDYELVTASLTPRRQAHLLNSMMPQGFRFFGHGHEHIWHDRLSYEEALHSFRTCYEAMQSLGLKPVAYAYPYGAGERPTTRRALAASGFLSGRLFERHLSDPFIVPGDALAPQDWFALPTLVMMNERALSFAADFVNDTKELMPYLDEAIARRAWLITTYHNIGNPQGWGFFELEDFQHDLDAVAQRDFWVASMSDVTLYVRERQTARVSAEWVRSTSGLEPELEIRLDDNLPNDRFDQPLTLIIATPETWSNHLVEAFQQDQMVTRAEVSQGTAVISLAPNEIPYRLRKLETGQGDGSVRGP